MLEFSLFVRNKFMAPIDIEVAKSVNNTISNALYEAACVDAEDVLSDLQIFSRYSNDFRSVLERIHSATDKSEHFLTVYDTRHERYLPAIKGSGTVDYYLYVDKIIPTEGLRLVHRGDVNYINGESQTLGFYYIIDPTNPDSGRTAYISPIEFDPDDLSFLFGDDGSNDSTESDSNSEA